jgi:hypothetical protein
MFEDMFQPWHIILLGVVAIFVVILPHWTIFKKAGFSPLLSLLMVLPLVSTIVLYFVAFSNWKVTPTPPFPPQA